MQLKVVIMKISVSFSLATPTVGTLKKKDTLA